MRNRTLGTAAKALGLLGVLFAAGVFLTQVPHYRLYVIHTGSMQQTIPSRSEILVKRGPVQVGQVITFYHGGEVVTHRLISINPDGTYVTKGDSNETVDPSSTKPSLVIGHVVFAPRGVGYWVYRFKQMTTYGPVICFLLALWLFIGAYRRRDPIKSPKLFAHLRRPRARHRAKSQLVSSSF